MTNDTLSDSSAQTPAPAERPRAADDTRRDAVATTLIDHYCVWAGAAGIIPVPLLDAAAAAGVQLQMLRRLSQLYGVPFAESRGRAVIASLAGAMVPATSGMGIASALKSVPLLGTLVASTLVPFGYAGATWIIGRMFMQHFASGGTLLDFSPRDYRHFIKAQEQEWRSRAAHEEPAAPGP